MICEWQNRKWVFSYLRCRNGERRIRRWRDSLQEFHQYSDISFACKTNICRLVEVYCYIYVKKQFDYTKLTRETEKELGEKDCIFNEKEENLSSTHLCSHFTNLDNIYPYSIPYVSESTADFSISIQAKSVRIVYIFLLRFSWMWIGLYS